MSASIPTTPTAVPASPNAVARRFAAWRREDERGLLPRRGLDALAPHGPGTTPGQRRAAEISGPAAAEDKEDHHAHRATARVTPGHDHQHPKQAEQREEDRHRPEPEGPPRPRHSPQIPGANAAHPGFAVAAAWMRSSPATPTRRLLGTTSECRAKSCSHARFLRNAVANAAPTPLSFGSKERID
jgi:hypothetical protein